MPKRARRATVRGNSMATRAQNGHLFGRYLNEMNISGRYGMRDILRDVSEVVAEAVPDQSRLILMVAQPFEKLFTVSESRPRSVAKKYGALVGNVDTDSRC